MSSSHAFTASVGCQVVTSRLLPTVVCCAAMMCGGAVARVGADLRDHRDPCAGHGGRLRRRRRRRVGDVVESGGTRVRGAASAASSSAATPDAPSDDATLGVSFVVPSLGLSYYRLRISEPLLVPAIGVPTGVAAPVLGVAVARLPTFVVDELGRDIRAVDRQPPGGGVDVETACGPTRSAATSTSARW